MAKKKEEGEKVAGYTLVNAQKVERALLGALNDKNEFIGGVQKDDGTYDNAELLAEYDRIGGLIRKNGDKVATGSFYDFKAKKPREKAAVVFVYKVNGEFVEIPEGKELPGEVKAAQMLEEKKKEVKKKK